MRSALILFASLCACGTSQPQPAATAPIVSPGAEEPEAIPFSFELSDFPAGLKTVRAEVGGVPRTFLFDTGAGVTTISAELAEQLGCEPYGRLTGHRQSGERIDMPLCRDVTITLGGRELQPHAVGVLDLAAMMPDDWPALDGVVGFNALDGHAVAVDIGCNRVEVDAEADASDQEAQIRLSRSASGLALGVFIAVSTRRPEATAWFQIDSANTAPVLVAEHIAPLLGVSENGEHPLRLTGFGDVTAEVAVMDMIHDGNIGASFLSNYIFRVDFRSSRAWVRPRSEVCGGTASQAAPNAAG